MNAWAPWLANDGETVGPCPDLLPFVQAFGTREAGFGAKSTYVPLPAGRDCFLDFYLQGRYRVVTVATGVEHWAPCCVLVGPSTQGLEDLKLSGSLQVFSIRFSPVGLNALFGILARLLRNRAIEAGLVLGREVVELHEQLAAAEPACWKIVAERSLLNVYTCATCLRQAELPHRQQPRGRVSVAEVAARSAVSTRHLERAFHEQVGVSPKVFGRLLRLDHALGLGEPRSNWGEIATTCGYFDQSHMVRDFRALTGATPVDLRRCVLRRRSCKRSCRFFPMRPITCLGSFGS